MDFDQIVYEAVPTVVQVFRQFAHNLNFFADAIESHAAATLAPNVSAPAPAPAPADVDGVTGVFLGES